jgi:hypothetical protein
VGFLSSNVSVDSWFGRWNGSACLRVDLLLK